MAEIMGSEFIVEMVAADALAPGDIVATIDYQDGTDIDDEAAHKDRGEPGQRRCGTCIKGGSRGKIVLVEFSSEGMTPHQNVLLYTLKKRQASRNSSTRGA